jgi:hypothetical protein
LTKAGADVEVCHIETSKDRDERLKKGVGKRGRKSSGMSDGVKKGTKRGRSVASISTTSSSRRASFSTTSGNSSSASSIHLLEDTRLQVNDSEEELEMESLRFASEEILPIHGDELDDAKIRPSIEGDLSERPIITPDRSYIRKRGDSSDSEIDCVMEEFRSAVKRTKRE